MQLEVFSEGDETPNKGPAQVTRDYYDVELRKSIRDGIRERFEELLREITGKFFNS